MHFQKRKRQSLGNKTFLQKKDMFLDDNDKDLSQLSLFFLQNVTNATSRSKWKLSYWLQALFGIFLLRLSTRPRPRWTIRKNGSRRKRGERRGKSNTIMKYCFLFLIYRERSHQFVQYLEVVRKNWRFRIFILSWHVEAGPRRLKLRLIRWKRLRRWRRLEPSKLSKMIIQSLELFDFLSIYQDSSSGHVSNRLQALWRK